MKRLWNLNTLLYVALLLALLSSLGHVAFAFSTVNGGNWIEAYISAVSIDVGLLALAAGINQRKANDRSAKWLWVGVVFFSAISTYANWLAGLAHVKDLETELGKSALWLVSLRPILLSAVLPILVIYLSEIVSSNYQTDQLAARKLKAPKVKADTLSDTNDVVLKRRKEKLSGKKNERLEVVSTLMHQGLTQAQIAKETGASVATIKRDYKELQNGKGK